jgi:kynureninase
MSVYENSLEFARASDAADPLRAFRAQFLFPQYIDTSLPQAPQRDIIYFTGNSLGLQPRLARAALERELHRWAELAVEGHFVADRAGETPWVSYHKQFEAPLARIVGARPHEVVAMNTLTVNLHLLMASFYRPTPKRCKILCEAGAFPSDQYALETQARFHGLNPDDVIVECAPRDGEHTLRTDDILAAIREHASELALVMFSGVQYYTGQVFDIQRITQAAQEAGAVAGWDLAHAVGNVELFLHEWNVDFAAWCSYKYLNSGPGCVAGAFVHERYADNQDLVRLAGWWGNEEQERFQMNKGFRPAFGTQSWQASNGNILGMAAHKAALDIFDQTSIAELRTKSRLLTGFLDFVIRDVAGVNINVITPPPPERGCQLSLVVSDSIPARNGQSGGRRVFDYLAENGVIVDWREPNVIRAAPAPLYNSFEDVWRFGQILREALLLEMEE